MINCGQVAVKNKERADLDAQIKAFKKSGGKIQKIPSHFSDCRSDHEWRNRKRSAELKAKKAAAGY